jgi:serine/threonine protein kinase
MSGNERFGPYRILRELGAGGMGRVSLAEREDLEGPVVIKRMNAELAADPRFRRRLLREAEVAAGLQHPNIVQVLDTGVIDDQLYLAMEYVPGSSLAGVLAASRPEPLPLVPVLHAVAQTCDGLAYVHRFAEPRTRKWMELVHRDVSLDNLLVSYSGEVKIADFGIVKTVDGTQTTSGVIMGKLGYMSPEQIRDETLDARSDVYSLGVCLFELVAGKRPLPATRSRSVMEAVLYDAPPPLEQLRQDVPRALSALVARMLSKDRQARPAACEEVAKELRAVLATRPEPTLFPSRLLNAPPRNRSPHAPVEVETQVEQRSATRPQRLQGAQPAPARKPTPVPEAHKQAPVPGVNARKPTPTPTPEVHKPAPVPGANARKPTPPPELETRGLAPAPAADARKPAVAARRGTPAQVPAAGKPAPTPGPEARRGTPAQIPAAPPRRPTPQPEYAHEPYELPTDIPSSEHAPAQASRPTSAQAADTVVGFSHPPSELSTDPSPEHQSGRSVYSIATQAPSAPPGHSVFSVATQAPSAPPGDSVFSVATRVPTPKPGDLPSPDDAPSVEAQPTRLLSTPRRGNRRRWAALGGLALLGAAVCWWWA